MPSVTSVVVTYNKKGLLAECLRAINKQSFPVNQIVVVDNCSTDGTEETVSLLEEEIGNINYYKLKKNIGGAGGFNFGLKKAFELNTDYYWIMDDDTIPKPKALEELMLASKKNVLEDWGFLCSNVKWIDDTPCIMNVPEPAEVWNEHLDQGLVKLISATFVSLLVSRNTIIDLGYPIKEFFIWGDDTEFTSRISKRTSGYMVAKSEVIHKMANNVGIDIVNDLSNRIDRYYFRYRNKAYTSKKMGIKYFAKFLFHTIYTLLKVLKKKNSNKFKKIKIIIRGYIAGLLFNPQVEYPNKNKIR